MIHTIFIKKLTRLVTIILVVFFTTQNVFATQTDVLNMSKAQQIITSKSTEYGAKNVLVVFDIDHTLLTPFGDLGASYWYKWQSKMIRTKDKEPTQLANTEEEFDQIVECVLDATPLRPVESTTATTLDQIKKAGVDVMAFTARAPELRSMTERELDAYGLNFKDNKLGSAFNNWEWPAAQIQKLFSAEEQTALNLDKLKTISYNNGILMGNEQNKGTILWAFLKRYNLANKYKAVIMVDDSISNCKSINEVFTKFSKVDITALHYIYERERFGAFNSGDYWSAIAEYNRKKPAIDACVKNLAKAKR